MMAEEKEPRLRPPLRAAIESPAPGDPNHDRRVWLHCALDEATLAYLHANSPSPSKPAVLTVSALRSWLLDQIREVRQRAKPTDLQREEHLAVNRYLKGDRLKEQIAQLDHRTKNQSKMILQQQETIERLSELLRFHGIAERRTCGLMSREEVIDAAGARKNLGNGRLLAGLLEFPALAL